MAAIHDAAIGNMDRSRTGFQWRDDAHPPDLRVQVHRGPIGWNLPKVEKPHIQPKAVLTTLPLELQLQIISYLPYPDVLALKLTSWHFSVLTVQSLSVISRVTWLLDRAEARLPIPKSNKLQLHDDGVFLRNKEVRRILRARRRHEECVAVWRGLKAGEKWPGCQVVSGLRLCSRGVELLEKSGGKRPVWTCGGDMIYMSDKLARDGRFWRMGLNRISVLVWTGIRETLSRLRLGWEQGDVVALRWFVIGCLIGLAAVVLGLAGLTR